MPLKQRKRIFLLKVTKLKIPTGRKQTSWLFEKRDRGFELRTTEKQIPLAAGWSPWTQSWRPEYNTSALNYSIILPSPFRSYTNHKATGHPGINLLMAFNLQVNFFIFSTDRAEDTIHTKKFLHSKLLLPSKFEYVSSTKCLQAFVI